VSRVEKVRELFTRALELDTGEHPGFLDRECADAALRREVESLLASRRRMGGFLERPAVDPPREHEPGETVGGYGIVRVLGRGGFGTVYEAMQKSPRRRVALKVVRRPGARFREEAEHLARLQHPGIAHIYEAGPDFLALEFVDGARPVTEAARGLDRRARVRLFASVCDAVHHGHQKGIVHRDLKPGNILVDAGGLPKVIDFGIARLVGAAAGERTGTPPYMSPEQCAPEGEPPDVRTDVYALGVVLDEVLGGERAIPRDLRAIVDKARAKRREDRYESAAALAADLRRFLRHEPVVARAGGPLYHLGRFARRQRAAFGTGVLLFAVTTTSAIVSTRLAFENARERRAAEWQSYVAGVTAADAAMRVHDVRAARERLAAAPPGLRGWEWSYLAAGLDRSVRTYRLPGWTVCGHWSPDGRLLAAATHEGYVSRGAVVVLDAETGGEIARRTVDSWVSVAFLSDGRLRWSRYDGAAFLSDPQDLGGPPALQLEGEAILQGAAAGMLTIDDERNLRLRAFPDGTLVAHVDEDCTRTIGPVFDGDRCAFVCNDRVELRTWPAGDMVGRLPGAGVVALAFADDGRLLGGRVDGSVGAWSRAGAPMGGFAARAGDAVHAIAARDGVVATGHGSGIVGVHRGGETAFLPGHESQVARLAFHPDGRTILSGATDGTMRLWDPDAPAPDACIHRPPRLVRDVAYAPCGGTLATACFDGVVRIHDPGSGAITAEIQGEGRATAVAFSPDGRLLAVVHEEMSVKLYEAGAWTLVAELDGHRSQTLGAAFSPDGTRLATGSKGGVILWDVAARAPVRAIPHERWVATPCFHPRTGELVTIDGKKRPKIVFHDGRTGRTLRAVALPAGCAPSPTLRYALHPRGGILAIASPGRVEVVEDGRAETLVEGTAGAEAVAFSPDGTRLAAGFGTNVILWDVATRDRVLTLRGHADLVHALAFHPGGAPIASGGGIYGGTGCELRLWGRALSREAGSGAGRLRR